MLSPDPVSRSSRCYSQLFGKIEAHKNRRGIERETARGAFIRNVRREGRRVEAHKKESVNGERV